MTLFVQKRADVASSLWLTKEYPVDDPAAFIPRVDREIATGLHTDRLTFPGADCRRQKSVQYHGLPTELYATSDDPQLPHALLQHATHRLSHLLQGVLTN